MKKYLTILLCCSFLFANSQDSSKTPLRSVTVKWAPTALVLGSAAFQAEYGFSEKNSLTAKIGVPVTVKHHLSFEGKQTAFTMQSMSFLAGYRSYLSKKMLRGFYLEPYFSYVHHTSEGVADDFLNGRPVQFSFTNDYSGTGLGLQLGTQFIISNRVVIDLFFFGPQFSISQNSFKASEMTNNTSWTNQESAEAEKKIRDFLDQFPFTRGNVNVQVDNHTRRVNAHFKGILPGIRAGVSFGVAF